MLARDLICATGLILYCTKESIKLTRQQLNMGQFVQIGQNQILYIYEWDLISVSAVYITKQIIVNKLLSVSMICYLTIISSTHWLNYTAGQGDQNRGNRFGKSNHSSHLIFPCPLVKLISVKMSPQELEGLRPMDIGVLVSQVN